MKPASMSQPDECPIDTTARACASAGRPAASAAARPQRRELSPRARSRKAPRRSHGCGCEPLRRAGARSRPAADMPRIAVHTASPRRSRRRKARPGPSPSSGNAESCAIAASSIDGVRQGTHVPQRGRGETSDARRPAWRPVRRGTVLRKFAASSMQPRAAYATRAGRLRAPCRHGTVPRVQAIDVGRGQDDPARMQRSSVLAEPDRLSGLGRQPVPAAILSSRPDARASAACAVKPTEGRSQSRHDPRSGVALRLVGAVQRCDDGLRHHRAGSTAPRRSWGPCCPGELASLECRSASAAVGRSSWRSLPGRPKSSATRSTPVSISSVSARSSTASMALDRSLSMTADTPW